MPTTSITRMVVKDPLHHLDPLPYSLTCYPLGFPLTLLTNSTAVLDAARASFDGWERAFDKPPIEYRVFVSDSAEGEFPGPPVFRAQGEIMSVIASPHNFAVTDFERGFAYCFVEQRVVDDGAWFRMRLLESVVFSMLSCSHLAAIHAACVMKQGRGILLHAPSGTGKSCLAYACARNGWTYVSDDASFFRREGASREVLGRPRTLKFVETAVNLFPELAARPLIVDPRGENVIQLDPVQESIPTAASAPVDAIVFLRREPGGLGLVELDREEAWELLVAELAVLTRRSYEEQKVAVRRLLGARVVELRYATLAQGVAALESLLGGLQ